MLLKNKNALITGGSRGLGLEVAKQFVLAGANIMLCARNAPDLLKAKNELLKENPHKVNIATQITDISKPAEIDFLIKQTLTLFGQLDILVANAGIYGAKGALEITDWADWSETIDINLKGTVYSCRALIPLFKKQSHGKIIILSGGGATKPLPYLSAYAASKAALVRFAETLAEELRDYTIDVNSVAPGALNTAMLTEILDAGAEIVGKDYYNQCVKQKEQGGTPLGLPAALCVFLASNASNGISGKLISAVWDPWQHFENHITQLSESDVYTLRRIIPKDRGLKMDIPQ